MGSGSVQTVVGRGRRARGARRHHAGAVQGPGGVRVRRSRHGGTGLLRQDVYGKVYAVLQRALEESDKAGIATFVMRGREYLVALKAENGLLTCIPCTGRTRSATPTRRSPTCRAGRSRPPPR
ncbi:Ku protein [Streptomyces sp. NPDC056255]|uniref:Ku protein n=1 Tax=Streptomyces sp. NPDC056255 TaxID=3345764 RepID=UPI0035E376DE